MGKKKGGGGSVAPVRDPALDARIASLDAQLVAERDRAERQNQSMNQQFAAAAEARAVAAAQSAQLSTLTTQLDGANAAISRAQVDASAAANRQDPTGTAAPVTDIPANSAEAAAALRDRQARTKSQRGRSALLIPLASSGGSGLAIPKA